MFRLVTFLQLALLAAAATLVVAAPAPDTYASSAGSNAYPVGAKGFSGVNKAKKPLRILLTNDDSWASANIRATYYALKTAGHNVLMVSPVQNQSGKGGTVVLPGVPTLTSPGRDNSVPAGAPYHGANLTDPGLTYVNATPGGAALYGIDQVAPTFFNGQDVQFVVSGPNEGSNLGPFLYTLSGTIGASYISVERNIPAIAFSGNTMQRDYKTLNFDDNTDQSIILATDTANLVSALNDNTRGSRVLPLGIGGSVNFGSGVGNNSVCGTSTKWVHTRMTGGAYIDKIVIGANGLPTYQNIVTNGINQCYSGDCSLPGEQNLYNSQPCSTAFSLYSVDYDAPTFAVARQEGTIATSLAQLNSKSSHKKHT